MAQKRFPLFNIGTSLILVVFMILALVTFATLSIVSSSNDEEQSRRTADQTTAYYAASNRAERLLAQIDEALLTAYQSAPEAYQQTVSQTLSTLSGVSVSEQDGEPTASFLLSVDDAQNLLVSLAIQPPDENGCCYRILSWSEQPAHDWEGDTSLKLIK